MAVNELLLQCPNFERQKRLLHTVLCFRFDIVFAFVKVSVMDLVPSDKGRIQPVVWEEYERIVKASEGKQVSERNRHIASFTDYINFLKDDKFVCNL